MKSLSPTRRRSVLIGVTLAALLVAGAYAIYTIVTPQDGRLPFFRAASPEKSQTGSSTQPGTRPADGYPVHAGITTTVFWIGEDATEDNKQIQNRDSTWVEDWMGRFGGVDDPENRCGYHPCGFIPKENAFYFALAYNDLNENGSRKPSASQIPWNNQGPSATESKSQVKNRWIKVTHGGKTAYAQWEDAGPYGEDDADYVFGDTSAKPAAPEAGLDLSPAAAGYLGIDGRGKADWQFVEEADVPAGPWRDRITRY